MRRKKTKLLIALTMVLVIFSSNVSLAATVFTDINGHWAKDFIEDIYNRKITSGYPDATFKPQGNITKLETIVMIAKLMGYSENDAAYYANLYGQKLTQNRIPDWGQGAVAYALFNDILLESELATLVATDNTTYAKRYEVAIYIGRVLQYRAGEPLSNIFVIPYKDEMSIPSSALPYIDLLLNKGILDKTSNDGRFLPNNLITRAEVAKLVSLAARILDSTAPTTPTTPTTPSKNVVKKTVDGYIDSIILGSKDIISIDTGKGKQIYEVDPKAEISLDGDDAYIEDLQKGQEIIAKVEDDIIVEIEAYSIEEEIEGFFYYYLGGQRPMVYIKDSKGNVKSLSFTRNSSVYLDNKSVSIEDLAEGDPVVIIYANDEIIEIDAEPREKTFTGIVRAKDKNTLEVFLDDEEIIESFEINSKTSIRRDRRSVDLSAIKIGDEVEITVDYDKVININAYSVRRTVEGYINNINFGQNMEITIEKFDGSLETFKLTPTTSIFIEGQRAGAYDLRLNYEVDLDIENDEVLTLEAYRKIHGASYSGKILYVDVRRNTIELEISNRQDIVIDVNEDTIYNDEFGELIELRDLNIGDEIIVYAEDNGFYVTAKRVLVLIRRR